MGNQKSVKLTRPLIVRRVDGQSMESTLTAGKLVVGWCYYKQLKPNQIIIFEHSGKEIIKRITRVEKEGLYVIGDNSQYSTDSREFGLINSSQVLARVLFTS